MSPKRDGFNISWGMVGLAVTILGAIGGFWVRTEVNAARLEAKFDAMSTRIGELKQFQDFRNGQLEDRLRNVERKRGR